LKDIYDKLSNRDFPSGYIIITGEPGIGKTAIMAELVKRTGSVHHFNISLQGIQSAEAFLKNICAQLIINYELDYPRMPPDAFKDGGFLSELLYQAANKLKGKPICIIVDALDEALDTGLDPSNNKLYLPQTLPTGIFFIITTRPKCNYRLVVDRQKHIPLDKDPRNLEDVSCYIEHFLANHQEIMKNRISEWGVTEEDFVEIMKERSEGNFIYITHILRDIYAGKISAKNINDVRDLPIGLLAYYQRHWDIMKALASGCETVFEKYYMPVICLLASAREPVSTNQLTEWARLSPLDIQQVIEKWYEFLNVDKTNLGEMKYSIYHISFREFLEKVEGLRPYHMIIAQTAYDKVLIRDKFA
jgi:hypothetical protein